MFIQPLLVYTKKGSRLKTLVPLLAIILLGLIHPVFGQQKSKLIIEHADYFNIDENKVPGAIVLSGNVKMSHEGVKMTCDKAYHFSKTNFIKAFGNVRFVQGDTIVMTSNNAEYDGNSKFALAMGGVRLKDPNMTLTTDTLKMNRVNQEAYYDNGGVIIQEDNTLKSTVGKYILQQKKYEFRSAVTLTNPDYVIRTNNLNYYTNSGKSDLYGPSTITGKDNLIYTEKGIYNTKTNRAKLLTNSYIRYNNQLIEGDSIYYDRTKEFSSITNNIRVTDSINKTLVKGDYAEIYRQKDSLFITKRAVIINDVENDSIYIHAKQFVITGKPSQRIIKGYPNVRIFKSDMSGKCDTIYSTENTGLTRMIGRPVVWNEDNQLTGKTIHLIADTNTQQLDSIKIIEDAFMIQKDSISADGYNQVKGVYLNGKIKDQQLSTIDVSKNTEVLYYTRNDDGELIGIDKSLSNSITITLDNNQIDTITLYKQIDGQLYPEDELPTNSRKLRGFEWREPERIKNLSELFLNEANE